MSGTEGRAGVNRIEAFSDGVIAIIVTIMILELHAPTKGGVEQLARLWPVFVAYLLSYVFVAIYWVNHHRLFSYATRVTNALMWSNMLLLFSLSLVPFSTAYLGQHRFGRDATLLYLVSVLLPALGYRWLQSVIRQTGRQGAVADAYHSETMRKGIVAGIVYIIGIPLSFLSPWLGIACVAVVAILWFLPKSPLDTLFSRSAGQGDG